MLHRHRPLTRVSDFIGAKRDIVDECLENLKATCLNRIREAFDRESSIVAPLQVRRFEAYRNAYKEHYTTMYERHTMSGDALCDGAVGFVGRTMEELLPGSSDSLLGPSRQDILGVVRMKNDPVGYQTRRR